MAGYIAADRSESFSKIGDKMTLDINGFHHVMDITTMLQHLLENSPEKRIEILTALTTIVKRNGGHLPIRLADRFAIYELFKCLLDDKKWEVRYQCLVLIAIAIPQLNEDLDTCMDVVLSKVFENLSHENFNVRNKALNVLHCYNQHTNNLQHFLQRYVKYGLENNDIQARKAAIASINILFTDELANENLAIIAEALAKHLETNDPVVFESVFLSLSRINDIVGPFSFQSYLKNVDDVTIKTYNMLKANNSRELSKTPIKIPLPFDQLPPSDLLANLEKKIVSKTTLMHFQDGNIDEKCQILEDLRKKILESQNLTLLFEDNSYFSALVNTGINDFNIKTNVIIFDILNIIIDRMQENLKQVVWPFVSMICRHLGDRQNVVRENLAKIIHKTMHFVPPLIVINVLVESKNSKNPRLREELVNRITAAILTFPSYNFEFTFLCEMVIPFLNDEKQRVRLAAFECLAALAQTLEPKKLPILLASLNALINNSKCIGLEEAVQARLSRRVLPRCTSDGHIIYFLSIPPSANKNSYITGADINWILAASRSTPSKTGEIHLPHIKALPTTKSKAISGDTLSVLGESDERESENGNFINELEDEHHRTLASGKARLFPNRPTVNPSLQPTKHSQNNRLSRSDESLSSTCTFIPRKSKIPQPKMKYEKLLRKVPPSSMTKSNSIPRLNPQKEIMQLGNHDHLKVSNEKETHWVNIVKDEQQTHFNQGYTKNDWKCENKSPLKQDIEIKESNGHLPCEIHDKEDESFALNLGSNSCIKSTNSSPLLSEVADDVNLDSCLHAKPNLHSFSIYSFSPTDSLREGFQSRVPPDDLSLRPCPNPEDALKKCLRLLSSSSWNLKVEGMELTRRLALYHPELLHSQTLHTILLALVEDVRCLRSAVARSAIRTISTLARSLPPRILDSDLDLILKTLLHKCGEGVSILKDDIYMTLDHVVENSSLIKAAFIASSVGTSHRNREVKKTSAQLLAMIVEKLGPAKCLAGGPKEVTEPLLAAAAHFVLDGMPLTRYYGRVIFYQLMFYPSFEKNYRKYLSLPTIQNIQPIIENLKIKGLGPIPTTSNNANLVVQNSKA